MIICRAEHAKKINSAVFPGQQGGPLEHVIAGKAVALRIAQTEAFRERQERTLAGAKAVADALLDAGHGVNVLTGGTDVHLVLVDLRESELDGQQAEDRLARGRHHGQPQRGAVRPAPADGHQRPARRRRRRWPRAACSSRTSPRSARSWPRRSRPGFDAGKERAGRAGSAIADRYPLYEHLAARGSGLMPDA